MFLPWFRPHFKWIRVLSISNTPMDQNHQSVHYGFIRIIYTYRYIQYIYIYVYHYIILYYHFSVWNPYLGPIVPQLFVVKPSNTQGPPAVRGATAWQDLGSMVAECWMVGEWLKKYVWKNKYIESMDWIGLPGERKNGCCLKHVETIEFSTSNGRFNRMAHKFCRTTIIQNLPFSFAG